MADDFRAWVSELDDDELEAERLHLLDLVALTEDGDAPDLLAQALGGLRLVVALQRRRELIAFLQAGCAAAVPDADPRAFAEAVAELSRAQRELGIDDTAAVWAGAMEVGRNRWTEHDERGM